MKSFIKATLLTLAASAISFAAPTCGGGVNVLTLNPGGCSAGGLLFSSFSVLPTPGASVFMQGSSVSGTTVNLTFAVIPPSLPGDVVLSYLVTGITNAIDFTVIGTPQAGISFTELACSTELCNGPNNIIYANIGNLNGGVTSGFATFNNGATPAQVWIKKDIQYTTATSQLTDFTNSHHAVPEPASMALVGSGLIGLGLLSRRRARK